MTLGEKARLKDPLTLHNLYVPAGGDIPDPKLNPKFEHKLSFLDEMRECTDVHVKGKERAILLGDLNVAPLEHDVWSHKQLLDVVSHTPIECEKFTAAQTYRRLGRRHARTRSGAGETLHVVELSLAGLEKLPTRAAGSITCGCRRNSPASLRASRSPRTRAAGQRRPITSRSRRRSNV